MAAVAGYQGCDALVNGTLRISIHQQCKIGMAVYINKSRANHFPFGINLLNCFKLILTLGGNNFSLLDRHFLYF